MLFRLSVVFLLRFAERRFLGLLFQEPPRRTRLRQGAVRLPSRIEDPTPEDRVAQAPGVGLLRMSNPGTDAAPDILHGDASGLPSVTQTTQTIAEAPYVILG